MSSNFVDAVKRLPLAERIELVEALWESITHDGYEPPLTLEQAAELDRRLEAHRRNPHDVVSWESIKEDLSSRQS
ncbi:MAG TPA: addiction module protein [Pyrinomonadaceae bacterium]